MSLHQLATSSLVRIVWSEEALRDISRLHAFLTGKSTDAARRAVKTIRRSVKDLGIHPEMGRLVDGMLPTFREWVIEFGQSAYLALYHYDGEEIVILAVRHGRELGY